MKREGFTFNAFSEHRTPLLLSSRDFDISQDLTPSGITASRTAARKPPTDQGSRSGVWTQVISHPERIEKKPISWGLKEIWEWVVITTVMAYSVFKTLMYFFG